MHSTSTESAAGTSPSGDLLAGKVAIVTGATSGIGKATAAALARGGAAVFGCGLPSDEHNQGGSDATSTTHRPVIEHIDVTDDAAMSRFAASVVERAGGIDIIVTAAGVQRYGTVTETTPELWDEVFDVNVRGTFLTLRHTIPHLRERGGGAIVVVSSVQAFMNQDAVAAYTASKGALNALTRAVAVDEAPFHIRANAVCPASVDTPMLRGSARMFSDGSDAGVDSLLHDWGSMHPLGRVGSASEVADAIVYLAGPQSSFITGVALPVDGGMLVKAPVVLPS